MAVVVEQMSTYTASIVGQMQLVADIFVIWSLFHCPCSESDIVTEL